MDETAPIGLATIRIERQFGALRIRLATCDDAARGGQVERIHLDPDDVIEDLRTFLTSWSADHP